MLEAPKTPHVITSLIRFSI